MKLKIYPAILVIGMIGNSCKKLVEVDLPQNQLSSQAVLSDSTTALSALVNIYALFPNTIDQTFHTSLSVYSDELDYSQNNPAINEFRQSYVSAANTRDLTLWKNFYFIIYSCNDLIGNLQSGDAMPESKVRQFTGEARFLRAFAFFYLTNLYGLVPLPLKNEVSSTALLARSDSASVYQQIVADLQSARGLLPVTYPSAGKVRANQYATTALLARVYLYRQDWAQAEQAAGTVINSRLYQLSAPGQTFTAGSAGTLLEFATPNGFNSSSTEFIPLSGKPNYPVSAHLITQFEPGDLRFSAWIKSTKVAGTTYDYPNKYHNRSANTSAPEYLVALRLAEQYLIRAEAEIRQNKLDAGLADLNTVRQTAGLTNLTLSNQAELINAVYQERETELFTEWGHRLFDLKRTGRANAVLGAAKPTWKTNISLLLPIPQNEIIHDHNLTQNAGY
ncbi:MAG: hypothetical protein JWR38_2863 [Mucilaginibacter sp.]|nr:hypothetical protein [Mucilaginibacter sp.]